MDEKSFSDKDIERGKKYFWDYIKHTNEVFLYRANVFLLAETILFAGFLSSVGSIDNSNITWVLFTFSSIIINLIWVHTSYKLLFISQKNAKKQLYERSSMFYDPFYSLARDKRKSFISSSLLLGIFLPILFIVAWLSITLILVF